MRILLQKCYICDYQCLYKVKNKKEESLIRASCLPCGHQGMFSLKEVNDENKSEKD